MFVLGGDRFQLLSQVGQGGYGVVYKARDLRLQRDVAVKLLQDAGHVADRRFEREAAVLSQLRHPGIVQYVAHGKAPSGQPYLVMDWLEGETLQQRMARTLLSLPDTLQLALRVVSALIYAESQGVVHRDIKPSNVILVDGQLRQATLVDFGLARRVEDRQQLTRSGFLVGTPMYMSPEQARGDQDVDTRADVFSLASVLYEALSGQPAFEAFNDFAALAKICFEEPAPIDELDPELPVAICELLRGMHQKERHRRPSHLQVADQLTRIAETVRVSARPVRSSERAVPHAAPSAATTISLRPDGQQRVLCVVFVGRSIEPSAELEPRLRALAEGSHARLQRLVDGSHILLLDAQLGATEQAIAAAHAALQLRTLLTQAPMVVCTGRARLSGLLPFGELIERGARLLAETDPGETRVDEASAALQAARFELIGAPGKRRLTRERRDTEAPRTVLGHSSVFVGRERELQSLQSTFDECVEESVARVVLVVAPAGAGKSRLRHELVERLKQGHHKLQVVTARADALRVGTQFGLLGSALRSWAALAGEDSAEHKGERLRARLRALLGHHGEGVGELLGELIGVHVDARGNAQDDARRDPQWMADQLQAAWLSWLEGLCAAGPVLLCVEDLHWSDPASNRLLEAALSSLQQRPLLLVGFARPELRDLYPLLFAARDPSELRLPKLGARAATQLLDAIADAELPAELRRQLVERADGNPFFLEELVRVHQQRADGVESGLPDTILGIIQTRLDGLGEQAKLLIRAASVLGQRFHTSALRFLLGGAGSRVDLAGWLALLVQREVIFQPGAGHEYAFRHALICDAAYLLLPDDERALGHRLAAQWLEQQPHAEPAPLASHFEKGGDLARAAHWYCAAAHAALEAGSLEDVVRCGERAAACGAQGIELGEVAANVAEALSFTGDDNAALHWTAVARAALPAGVPAWWRTLQVAAITNVRRAAPDLEAQVHALLTQQPADDAEPARLIALSYLACEAIRTSQLELSRRVLAQLPREPNEALGARVQGCVACAWAQDAWGRSDLSDALRQAQRALAVFRAAGALKDLAGMLNINGYLQLELGCYEQAEQALREEVEIGQRIAAHNDIYSGTQNLGVIFAARGRLDDAERALRDSARGFARLGMVSFQALSLVHLATVALRRGALDECAALLEEAFSCGALEDVTRALALSVQARLALERNETEAALSLSGQAALLVREGRVLEYVATIRAAYIDSLLACGQRAEAAHESAEAKRWLLERAGNITDDALRQTFLQRVPENAAILALSTHEG